MMLSIAAGEIVSDDRGLFAGMVRSARLDGPELCYRYELGRSWDFTKPLLVVCMLNPSTADHNIDDPTIKTLIHFANLWGHGALRIVNLYAWRSPSPAQMMRQEGRMGPHNRFYLADAMAQAKHTSGRLLVAWGNDGNFDGEADWFASRAVGHYGLELICLGKTLDGSPKHPMARGVHRIPRDQRPIIWRAPV